MMELTKTLLKPLFTRLPSGLQSRIRDRRHVRRTVKQNIAAVRQGERLVPEAELERKYVEALRYLGRFDPEYAAVGDYLEFGVYNGSSLACAYRALTAVGASRARLFGFDSFQGLPEDAATEEGGGLWRPGDFRMDEKFTRRFLTEQGVDWSRVTLIKGWFNETLNAVTLQRHAIGKASLIMVDCDIYTSSRTVLDFCEPLIADRAVVFFDDWFSGGLAERNQGEKRAFDETLAAHPDLSAEDFGDYGVNGKVFVVSRRAPASASEVRPQ